MSEHMSETERNEYEAWLETIGERLGESAGDESEQWTPGDIAPNGAVVPVARTRNGDGDAASLSPAFVK